MSHHLDSPAARQDVRLDITDFYVFRGERGTVFVLNVNNSITGPDAPHGFHHEGRYEFRIDTDGDARQDLAYRFTFGEPGADGEQSWTLHRLTGAPSSDDATGIGAGTEVVTGVTGVTGREAAGGGGGGERVWAGRAGDPFWIDHDVLVAVGEAFGHGERVDLSGWDRGKATNVFAGQTVHSIVLEIPDEELLRQTGGAHTLGTWAVSILATDAGGWRQIQRAGHPMFQPLFSQHDPDLGDRYNTTRPDQDRELYADLIAGRIADVVAAHGAAEDARTAEDARAYGEVMTGFLFPDVLPYRVGSPAVYGFAGCNGRTLTDSVVDVMFSLATNTPFDAGLTKDCVTARPTNTFPYVAPVARTAE
ncbi:DUF4331 family protein [Streptomyces griseiscabiei]|uniref:DUF4331 family protein n=1 Tax=Streptomyces griseiscabiei TaxID=2993540 RepID=A0ABU4KXF3_9ACTN|nr:DUF4331 family protein [Streptomyces griseiscabiei]MBZ3904360.1 DUF4331 family protein [Streptomyces griseiscabiei]MDX2908107.1 DUF4331 family protein [Streptomyces griseiscabiei]